MKFKIGDKVKYISGNYGDYEDNPLWGGKFGKVIGKICRISGSISVNWQNSTHNSYGAEDLAFLNKNHNNHPLTKIFL